MISFTSLTLADIPRLHTWFNEPHVQAFYSLRNWTEAQVLQKLQPILLREKPINGFIIHYHDKPIGYIQYYKVCDFPWPEQELPLTSVIHVAGMDLFIGEHKYLHQGIGTQILKQFLLTFIWPKFDSCVVDPDIANIAAIRCYQKIGFQMHKIIKTENALHIPVNLQLMIKNKLQGE